MSYPHWIYDKSDIEDNFGFGERAVEFLKRLKHPKSNLPGKAFQLDDWQERIVRRIYGPRNKDGSRKVKTVFLLLPRGNRKTSLSAALALLHTIGPEKLPGGEVVFAASNRQQARLGFDEATGIINETKSIKPHVRILEYKHCVRFPRNGSFFASISSDAGAQHGRTPAFVLADELHAWPKRDLWDVLRSGLPKTRGSLLIVATTAGRGQENISAEIYDYAKRVASGEIEDEAFLPILFEAKKDDDWRNEKVWFDTNPGLQLGYPDIEGLRQLAREASHRPGDREAFRQLHLNVWLDNSRDPFVDMDVYDKGSDPIDEESLKDQPCWIGVDLSSNTDLTAVVACWKIDEKYVVKPHFFCPGDNLKERADRDGVPYPRWHDEGYIEATQGNVVDFDRVSTVIRELCDTYEVAEIAFDPHMARMMISSLLEDGYPAVEMRQGWITLAPAIKELERAIISGNFQHGGNPILRWHFENIAVQTDSSGNRSFHKGKSRDRIDGAFAAAMAVGRANFGDTGRSIYLNEKVRPDGLLII